MILDKIVRLKKEELEIIKRQVPLSDLRTRIAKIQPGYDFAYALCQSGGACSEISIIAEIKKASPSAGILRDDFDPIAIAEAYQQNKAAAISILTEGRFFYGSLDYLSQVRQLVSLPILRKDFIFDEYQLYETKANKADAALLIAAILSKGELEHLYGLAIELGLCPLIESHTWSELDMVLQLDPVLVGINNRNLETFKTDIGITLSMLCDIPEEKLVISESGIHSRDDIITLEQAGVSAVLI